MTVRVLTAKTRRLGRFTWEAVVTDGRETAYSSYCFTRAGAIRDATRRYRRRLVPWVDADKVTEKGRIL